MGKLPRSDQHSEEEEGQVQVGGPTSSGVPAATHLGWGALGLLLPRPPLTSLGYRCWQTHQVSPEQESGEGNDVEGPPPK